MGGAPSATTATGSAVMSLQESSEACRHELTVDQGGDCVTVVPGINLPALQEKSLTCNRIPETVRGVFTGSVRHRQLSPAV